MKNLSLDWFDVVSSWTRRAKPGSSAKAERPWTRGLIEPLESRIAPAGVDLFANAAILTGVSANDVGSNAGTSGELGEPNHAGASIPLNSVWWQWTPQFSGFVDINTIGSSLDTTLGIYTGNSVDQLVQVAANEDIDFAAANYQSQVNFFASAGVTYRIALDGYGSDVGNYVLNLNQTPVATTLDAALSSGQLTISDTDGANNTLTFSTDGTNLLVTDANQRFNVAPAGGALSNENRTLSIPLSSLPNGVIINGNGGDDSVILNLASGDLIPGGGVTFNGGGQISPVGDRLTIQGGAQGNVTYNYANANDGDIVMSNFGTVTYTGLEPITNTGSATNIIFNLPVLPVGQSNSAILADDGAANTLSRLSGATFELTDFVSPSGTITINPGNSTDTIQVGSPTDLTSGLVIGSTGDAFSDVTFVGSVALGLDKNLSATASNSINVGATASLTTIGTGNIALTGTTVSGSGGITTGGGLTVNLSGTSTFAGVIAGGGGLTKTGIGTLSLTGTNTYGGLTSVNVGALSVENSSALGGSAQGTTVAVGASLNLLGNVTIAAEPLTLSGGGVGSVGALRNISGNNTWGGFIDAQNVGGAGVHLRIASDAGTLNITGDIATAVAGSGNLFVLQGNGNGVVSGDISGPAHLTKSSMGGGTWTLAGTNTYTGPTAISAGTLLVTGSTLSASSFSVASGTTLGGTGTIAGVVSVQGGGTLSPGVAGAGTLTIGSLILNTNSTVALQLNGSAAASYDRVVSTGNITINTGVSLSLSGSHVPVLGNTFGVISATGTVTGTFNGVANGSTVLFQNQPLQAAYTSPAPGGFQLSYDQTPVIAGTAGNDLFEVSEDGAGNLVVTRGGTTVMSTPLNSLTSLIIDGGAGDDTLTVAYNGAGGFFNLPITFNGGTQGLDGDSLVITGTPQAIGTVTHTFSNANDGNVNIDGTVITYTGLEPIIDNLSATNRVFNFNGGTESISLVDSGAGTMTIDSTLGESVTFANPATSITINAGTGNDSISINSMSAAYTGALAINGDAGTDTLSFGAGPFGLSGLTINSETLNALPGLNIGAGGLQITTSNGISQSAAIGVVGPINLNAGASAVTLANPANDFQNTVTVTGGNVTLRDANALQLTSITAGGNVIVTAGLGLTVGTVNSGGTTVQLSSTDGAILDGNAAGLNVVGSHLNLTAATGISLDTAVTTLEGINQTSGNVTIREANALGIVQLRLLGANGDLSVTNGTINTDITTTGLIEGSDTGTILVRSQGQLTLGGDVLGGSGQITLEANRNVQIGGAITATGNVVIDADLNNDNSGAISSAIGTLVSGNALTLRSAEGIEIRTAASTVTFDNSLSGRVTVLESNGALVAGTNDGDDVVLHSVTGNLQLGAISAPGSTVVVRAQGGSILDGNGGLDNISALAAILVASNGIGSPGDALETTIAQLEAEAGNGGLYVSELNQLQVGGVVDPLGALPSAVTGISATSGDIRINSGALSIIAQISTPGNVLLTALGSITETGAGAIAAALLQTNSSGGQALGGLNTVRGFNAINSTADTDVWLRNNSLAAPAPGPLDIIGVSNTTGGDIRIENIGSAIITGFVGSGNNPTPLGGEIRITSTELLAVAPTGTVSSRGGSGGDLTLSDNLIVDGTVTVGFGDIILDGGDGDLNINAPITVETNLTLNATGNINIRAKVEAALTTNHLTLVADTDLNAQGGIRIFPQGELKAGGDLTLSGSDYFGTGPIDSIIIDADLTGAAQLGAFGNIRLLNGSAAPVGSAIHLGGYVNALTTGNVTFEHAVKLTADTARVATRGEGNILFNGTLDGAYDLRLSTDVGVITFDDRVGAHADVPGNVTTGDVTIDSALDVTVASSFDAQSLTILNTSGTVAIAGPVTTHALGNNFVVNANALNLGGMVSAGPGNIVWSVDNLAIEAPVAGSGTLTIQPLTANRSIGLNGTGGLNLTTTEVDYLVDGFAGIQIGAVGRASAITLGAVTFKDSVSIIAPAAGGTINVLGTITGIGNASVSLQAPSIALNVAGTAIDTADADVVLTGAVVLGANTTINTHNGISGGTFTQNGTINGPFDFAVETIDGDINLNGSNSAGGPGLGNSQALASAVFLGGTINLRTQVVTTGNQIYLGADINVFSGSVKAAGLGSIQFLGAVDLAPVVPITTNGGAIFFAASVERISAAGGLRLNAGSGSVIFNGPVGPLASLTVLSAGAANFESSMNVQGPISLAADEINFNGGAGSISGSSSIELKPVSANAPTEIGGTGNQPGILDLTQNDIQALANGFTSIKIGRDLGEAGMTIVPGPGVTFQDPVIFDQSGRGGIVTISGPLHGIDNASFDFKSGLTTFSSPGPITITTANQPVSFDAVVIGTDVTIDTGAGSGSVTFRSTVADNLGGNDLTINAGTGDITFTRTVGTRNAPTLGAIELTSGGTTRINGALYAESLGINASVPAFGTTEILAKSITTSGEAGQIYNSAVKLNSSVRFNTMNADINFAGTIESKPGKAYSVSVTAGTGDVLFVGAIGENVPLGTVRVKTQGIATFDGDIFAKTVTIAASTFSVNNVTASTSQSYTGAGTFEGVLSGAKLKINTTIDLISDEDWNIAGRTTLKAKGKNISLTGANQFGELDIVSATNAVIHEGFGEMTIRSANVTGALTLVADGNITDGKRIRVGNLVASTLTGSIVLDGVNRIASLGAVTSQTGILILSGGTHMSLTNVISTETGNVIIVGNDRSSKNVIVNGGTIDLNEGGGFYRIYTYDVTLGNFGSLSPEFTETLGNRYPYVPSGADAGANAIIGSRIL